jgi:hypothetical protein
MGNTLRDPQVLATKLLDLFERAHAALIATRQATAERSMFAAIEGPQRPTEVTEIEAWDAYVTALQQHTDRRNQIQAKSKATAAAWEEIQEEVLAALPKLVWFKVGAFGIGIAETNWAHEKFYVVIEPWASPMASLNRKYTGD